ncbi:MAG: glycosyltransferase family 39 protein [Candidatus Nealsonbacteria bacterium]|nr:glycosyltransferase family 39 protein [Candidatus Nealsonbacteria bacterium]
MKFAAWMQIVLLLAVALAVRWSAAEYWQLRCAGEFGFPDSETYWTLGREIAEGRPYRVGPHAAEVFRTPGYPLLLAPLFLLADDEPPVMWARAVSVVLGTLAVVAVWWLTRQLFDGRAAMIAGVVAALYPEAIAASTFVLSEAPFCLLMLVQFILWTAACRSDAPWRAGRLAACAGLVAAVATLVRPSWLLFTPLAVVAAVVAGHKSEPPGLPRRGVQGPVQRGGEPRGSLVCLGVVMLAGLIVGMTPWWIRNVRATGRFVPTTLQVGVSLYDGQSPEATGASDMSFVPGMTEEFRRQESGVADGAATTFEYRLDRHFRDEAVAWACSHPGEVVELAGVKFRRMWNVWPNEATMSSRPVRAAVLLSYVPVLVLGLFGAIRTIRLGSPYILCWLPAVYFTALHVVFVGSIRYRQPAMLGLIVLGAGVFASRRGRPTTVNTGVTRPWRVVSDLYATD